MAVDELADLVRVDAKLNPRYRPDAQHQHPAPATGRINHVLYVAAISQIRQDSEGRRYYRRKVQEAKTSKEALRCLKRRLSDLVYRQLRADAIQVAGGPGPSSPGGPGRALGGV